MTARSRSTAGFRSGILGLVARTHDLAQLNIGRIVVPLDSPQMHGFVSRLDEINALAERSPGFAWRLIGEGNDATSLRPFPDDFMLVNMSTWHSLEELRDFVYRSAHRQLLGERQKWFEAMREAFTVLWWVPAGHEPTVDEAKERLTMLREQGPTPAAFTFKDAFPAPQ